MDPSKPNKVTAAHVEANRRFNVRVPKAQEQDLLNLMKSNVKGILTAEEIKGFLEYRESYFNQLLDLKSVGGSPSWVHDKLKHLMSYSAQVVDPATAVLFLNCYKHFKPERTEEQMDKANYYAWAILAIHGIVFVIDDIMDGAATRRYKPAYCIEAGANLAWMRSLTLLQLISQGLVQKFRNDSKGYDAIESFTCYASQGYLSLLLDLEASKSPETWFDLNYRLHHNNCLSGSVFDLPFQGAAALAGRKVTSEELATWKKLTAAVIAIFRNMNDKIDSFPEAPHGKPLYSDISNGTPSWLSGTAWQLANEHQRQILKENYGCKDDDKIANVLQIYREVDIEGHYKRESHEMAINLKKLIKELPEDLAPKKVLVELVGYSSVEHQGLAWS